MPEAVLQRAAEEMLDWHGSGMGVMEMSHRGKEFGVIATAAEADLRALLAVPSDFQDPVHAGRRAGRERDRSAQPVARHRRRFCRHGQLERSSLKKRRSANIADVQIAVATSEDNGPTTPAAAIRPAGNCGQDAASYVHLSAPMKPSTVWSFKQLPDLAALGSQAPLVIDFSSHVASRPVDWSKVGLAFGGAQKNLGPAGLTIVIVRDDLLGRALEVCPSAFNYKTVADNQSMYNTPPTWGIYIAGLTFQWLRQQTEGALSGVEAMEARNIAKARLLYDFIDGSAFYDNRVDPSCRSRMNVPFFLADEGRNDAFLAGARAAGLLQLKGHKSVGGMRASIYNAMPLAGVQALVGYMREFERSHA